MEKPVSIRLRFSFSTSSSSCAISFNIAGGLWFSMKPGTHYLDQEEWLFSSIWLPQIREFDMVAKALLGVKLLINETTSYSDFKEFQVSVHDSVTLPK